MIDGNFNAQTSVVSSKKHFVIIIMIVRINQMNQKDVLRQLNTEVNVLPTILIAKMGTVLRWNGSVMDV